MAYSNYGNTTYPFLMNSPALPVDPDSPTPASRVEQAAISAATWLSAIQDLIDNGTLGNQIHFGTAVSGTEGNIEVTVADSKEHDVYWNISSFNVYKAVAANTWNYIGKVKGADGTPGTDGDDGVGISSATVNGSGHLILTLTDTNTIDAGAVKGADGAGSGWTLLTDSSSGSCSVTLTNGCYFILTSASVSALTVSDGFSAVGDTATVEFTSPSTAATYSAPSGSKHYGDDCSGGDFTPAANVTYKIVYEKWNSGLTSYVKARS